MLSSEKITAYISELCNQVRWQAAHPRIKKEIEAQIIDERDSYMTQGMNEDDATDRAIEDTGDATLIGARFDRTYRHSPQWGMLAAITGFLTFGFFIRMFIFSDDDFHGYIFFKILAFILGTSLLCIAYLSDFSRIGRYPRIFYFSMMAPILVAPWVRGDPGVPLAQFMTLTLPLALSAIIFACRKKGYRGLLISILAFSVQLFIALHIPSITGLLIYAVSGIVLLCVAVHKKWFGIKRTYGYLIVLMLIAFISIMFISFANHYWLDRLEVAINPYIDFNGVGYISAVTKGLLGGANWIGRAVSLAQYGGASTVFTRSVFYTDLLLLALIVRWGWISFAVIIGFFLIFIVKGFSLCLKQKSSLGMLVSLAVMLTFTMQVVYYVIYNLGFQFAPPLSLPLISNSGTGTMVNMWLLGVMLSVFRTGHITREEESIPANKNIPT